MSEIRIHQRHDGKPVCPASLPGTNRYAPKSEGFAGEGAHLSMRPLAPITLNCVANLNFRIHRSLPPHEQARRQLDASRRGWFWSRADLELAPCYAFGRGTLPAVLLSGWDAHGEGRATLPFSKWQSFSGLTRVVHCADLMRLTKAYVLGQSQGAEEVRPARGYRNEN
jgi:hypothetical protein